MPLKPLASQKKVDYVIEQIVLAIREGQYSVGQRLPPERELAALLNVSRASVREAFGILQMAGVVSVEHGKGTFVLSLPTLRLLTQPFASLVSGGEELVQLTTARYALEQGMSHVAASVRDETGLRLMRDALEAMNGSVEEHSVEAFLDADISFHTGLAQATGNGYLEGTSAELISVLAKPDHRRVRREAYEADEQQIRDALRVHKDLYGAIDGGDTTAAVAAVHRHYADVVAPLMEGKEGDFGSDGTPHTISSGEYTE